MLKNLFLASAFVCGMAFAAGETQVTLVTTPETSPFSLETILSFQKEEVHNRRESLTEQEEAEFTNQLDLQMNGLKAGDRTLFLVSEGETLMGVAWLIPNRETQTVHIANGTCKKNADYLSVVLSASKAYPDTKTIETTVHNSRTLLNGLLEKGQWTKAETPKDAYHSLPESYTTWQLSVEGLPAFLQVAKEAFAALQAKPIH